MRNKFFQALAILAFASAGALFAQSAGKIKVVVSDADGQPLPGVVVNAESDTTLTKRSRVTDEKGSTMLTNLPPAGNWVVTCSFTGFNTTQNKNVLVRNSQTTTLNVTMTPAGVEESLVVVAESPVVDVTSSLSGQDITLELTESLPTARSYQDYLQLVPGVAPTTDSNPASRSGINYSDILGDVGSSSDNFYFVEGINITDNETGTFGANLNTEIIQEQNVKTGGVPAEYVGATGLISNITTKEGGNDFSGSINYFFQSDSLVADNDNEENESFSRYDTAVTFGGPIIKDKLWFFTSWRITQREDDVAAGGDLRTVTTDGDQAFFKMSWQLTESDKITGVFFNDPQESDGSRSSSIRNIRDRGSEQGGDNFKLQYSRVFGAGIFDIAYKKHEAQLNTVASVLTPRNDVSYIGEDIAGQDQGNLTQQGGAGFINFRDRDSEGYTAKVEYVLDSSFGTHTLKAGYEFLEFSNFQNRTFPEANGERAQWSSLGTQYQGTTAESFLDDNWTSLDWSPSSVSDIGGLMNGIAGSANVSSHLAALGVGSVAEMEALSDRDFASRLVFNSTAGNPGGFVNYYRNIITREGPLETSTEGSSIFLQDNIEFGNWTVNAGIRLEEWEHFASTGENIMTFDYEVAPRLSVAWDIGGEGTQRASFYYGRYFDPIRTNMTNFAGTLTGRVTDEQVYFNDEWITFRTRGGDVTQDAFFAPTTKTPYTDEFQLSYARDFGGNMSFEVNLIKRETRDLLEDYDLALYAVDPHNEHHYPFAGSLEGVDVTTAAGAEQARANSLWLGLDYFGYDVNPGSNFVIATLDGAERDYDGLELVFRKRFSDNWQVLASYNYADGTGNSNSDSNADFAGDVLWLDPRGLNIGGTQPGSLDHIAKIAGSYTFDMGIQLGGTYRWNSGSYSTEAWRLFSRNLPFLNFSEQTVFMNTLENWALDGVWGGLQNPSYGTLDLRVQYNMNFMERYKLEAFIDVFNTLDDQATTVEESLRAGGDIGDFGEGISWVAPRRFFLGARLSF